MAKHTVFQRSYEYILLCRAVLLDLGKREREKNMNLSTCDFVIYDKHNKTCVKSASDLQLVQS